MCFFQLYKDVRQTKRNASVKERKEKQIQAARGVHFISLQKPIAYVLAKENMLLLAFAFFIVSFLFFCLALGFERKLAWIRLEQTHNELQRQIEEERERSERLVARRNELQEIPDNLEELDREELDKLLASLEELRAYVSNQIKERSSGSASSSSADKKSV